MGFFDRAADPNFINLFPKTWMPAAPELRDMRLADTGQLSRNMPKFSLTTEFGQIDYLRLGKPGRKTLLFIPGIPDQLFTFHKVLEILSRDYDVVAISPPGKGYSTHQPPFDFRIDTYARFWKMIIETLDLHDITAIAHSAGLAEIVHALIQYGQDDLRVDRLVSICGWSPAIVPEPLSISFVEWMLGSPAGPALYRLFSESRRFGLGAFFRKCFYGRIPARDFATLQHEYCRVWPRRDPKTQDFDEQRIFAICESVRQQNELSRDVKDYYQRQRKRLWRLEALPVLVVGATHDAFVHGSRDWRSGKRNGQEIRYVDTQGKTYAERLFQGFHQVSGSPHNTSILIYKTGHMLPLETPVPLARAIDRFVKETAEDPATETHFHKILAHSAWNPNGTPLGLGPMKTVQEEAL